LLNIPYLLKIINFFKKILPRLNITYKKIKIMETIEPVKTKYKATRHNQIPGISIELNTPGTNEYTKLSYPVKYGLFSRIDTQNFIFEFNLNHEIRHAKSKIKQWIHPSEWLKRTMGNDWVYYSTGGYAGVYEALGEYYLPNLMYPTNSLLGGKPFKEDAIHGIVNNWDEMISHLPDSGLPDRILRWIKAIKQQTPQSLQILRSLKKLIRIYILLRLIQSGCTRYL